MIHPDNNGGFQFSAPTSALNLGNASVSVRPSVLQEAPNRSGSRETSRANEKFLNLKAEIWGALAAPTPIMSARKKVYKFIKKARQKMPWHDKLIEQLKNRSLHAPIRLPYISTKSGTVQHYNLVSFL